MRQVNKAVKSFLEGKELTAQDVSVERHPRFDVLSLKVHGDTVATNFNGIVAVTCRDTVTKNKVEVINKIPNAHVEYRDDKLYFNGTRWDGELIAV